MKQITLSFTEQTILRAIDLNAEIPVPEIAKRTGLNAPQVHRVINRLVEREILVGVTAQIDFSRIGIVEYGINLAVATDTEQKREKFISSLIKEKRVGWVAEVGADYDCMLNVLARTPHEVDSVLGKAYQNLSGSVLHKTICVRLRRTRYDRGVFGASSKRKPQFQIGITPDVQVIDKLDGEILALLTTSNRASFRDLARQLSVSSSTFSRRIQSLKERAILLGFSWHMNLSRCAVLQYRVLVSLRSNPPALREKLSRIVQGTPAIKMFADCIGAWDYEMELDVWSAQEVKPVISSISTACSDLLERITVIPIFKHRKFSSFPVEDS